MGFAELRSPFTNSLIRRSSTLSFIVSINHPRESRSGSNVVEDATGDRTVLCTGAGHRSFRLIEFIGERRAATELLESIRRGGSGSADGYHNSTWTHYDAQSGSGKQQTRIGFGFEPWIQRFAGGEASDGIGGSELRRRTWSTTSFRTTLDH